MSTTEPQEAASDEPQLIAGWLETSDGQYAGYYVHEPDPGPDPETPLSDAEHRLGQVRMKAQSMAGDRDETVRRCGEQVLAVLGDAAEPDELAAFRRSVRILAGITARNHQVMEAARIEMGQNGPHAAMQWILNALPDVWDDDETAWDGKESAEEWFDRTESFYRAAQADAEPAVPPPPVAAALDRPTIDAEAPDARSPQAGSPGPVAAATAWAGGKSAEAWNAAAAAIPAEWVKAAENHYSMHGAGLLRNILAGVAPLIAAEAVSTERERTDDLKAELGEARSEAQMIRTHAHRVLVAVYGPDYVYRAPETFGNLLERWIWAVAAEVPEMAHASIADIERHCAERDGADHG